MFSSRWRKVVRDLWSNKTRTVLIVLAIAVGVFAFGSVFTTQEILLTDMNRGYRATNPSTITMRSGSFDESILGWMMRQPEVADAQLRSQYSAKLVNGNEKELLTLFSFSDYRSNTINQITPEEGSWPPGNGEILLERSNVSAIGSKPGEDLTLEMPDGRKYQLTFTGTVHDMDVFPGTMSRRVNGYVTEKTVTKLGLPRVYNRLDIVTRPELATREQIETAADDIEERLEKNGVAVSSEVREPGDYWARSTTEGFSLILTVMGVFSLALSGFLVINTVSALLIEQRRQVGIMKAVGGTGGQIAGLYLALVIVYGLLALTVAVPVGLALAYAFISSVTRFLNIDLLSFHLPLRVLLLQSLAALLVPVLASAIPILGGVRVSVREAISERGIGNRSQHGFLNRMVMQVRYLPRPMLMSLRNTFRRKARLCLTLSTLVLAGALFVTMANVRGSLSGLLDDILDAEFNYQVHVSLTRPVDRLGLEKRVERLDGVAKAEGWAYMGAQFVKPDGSRGESFTISGLPHGSDFAQPVALSGRWFDATDRNAVVISRTLANELGDVEPGSMITLVSSEEKRTWQVAGIDEKGLDRAAYANFDYVSKLRGTPGDATSVLVRTVSKDGASQARMAKAVEQYLKDSGIGVGGSITRDAIVSQNTSQFDFLVSFLLSMAAMAALIGALGLTGMMSLNVMERTREIGVMRSIGASNGAIMGIVIAEGLLVGLISWALAVPLSIPVSTAFNTMLGNILIEAPLDLVFSRTTPFIWLGIIAAVSITASLLPAYRAMRMSIRETLAYE